MLETVSDLRMGLANGDAESSSSQADRFIQYSGFGFASPIALKIDSMHAKESNVANRAPEMNNRGGFLKRPVATL